MIYGDNPILLSVNYIKADKKKGIKESFEVIYKTPGGVVYKTNEPAEADIYIVKPEYRNFSYHKPQEHMKYMEKITCLVSEIRYKIAEAIGEEGKLFVQQCFDNGDYKALSRLYGWQYAFGCDFQPEFYYMRSWYQKYGQIPPGQKLTKAYLDIEIDLIDTMVDLDNLTSSAYAPVNLVTVFLDETNESYTFILRPYKPPRVGVAPDMYEERLEMYKKQLAAHEDMMKNSKIFIKDLHNSFDATYGADIKYGIREYEKEIDLIADVFKLINTKKPNFCLSWNMRFDIQYLMERIKALGYDPRSIMCSGDFQSKRCYFHVDRLMFNLDKQFDFFHCSSYTHYICQMRLYASIRKSQHTLKSVKLNDIGERELRDRKVEYPAEANIARFPYVDWQRFVKYNIKDVLLQVGIERKTDDVMTYYSKSHSNLTPYNKIFRETHLLRNVREQYFERDGWVQGNNVNAIGRDEDLEWAKIVNESDSESEKSTGSGKTSFKGAINADPRMNDYVGLMVMGQASNSLFMNSMDYDMGAFYPSIKIASNMDPSTLLAKASFKNDEFMSGEYVNRSLNSQYTEIDKNGDERNLDITGEAVNAYCAGNVQTFVYNFMGIPGTDELLRGAQRECRRR